jgi:hypothetical protein
MARIYFWAIAEAFASSHVSTSLATSWAQWRHVPQFWNTIGFSWVPTCSAVARPIVPTGKKNVDVPIGMATVPQPVVDVAPRLVISRDELRVVSVVYDLQSLPASKFCLEIVDRVEHAAVDVHEPIARLWTDKDADLFLLRFRRNRLRTPWRRPRVLQQGDKCDGSDGDGHVVSRAHSLAADTLDLVLRLGRGDYPIYGLLPDVSKEVNDRRNDQNRMQSYIRPVVKPHRLLAIMGIRAEGQSLKSDLTCQRRYRPCSVPVRPITP